MKQALLILLVVFTTTACGNKKTDAVDTTAVTSPENTEIVSVAATNPSTVYVYYFHGKQRCKTCIAVQNKAKEAIDQMYGGNQNVQFMEVLIEDAGYKELVEKYGVSWSTLIVAKGGDYIDITQNSFANPEGVKELLKAEVDRRL